MSKDKKPPVDIELARKYLRYDSETGNHYWLVDRTGGVKAGDKAGSLRSDGYVYIKLLGNKYSAHRLAYAVYHNDDLNGFEVNHLNHITDDNRIGNLKKVDRSGQMRDLAMSSRNKSGFTGVCWDKSSKKWMARVGKQYIGLFEDVELAGFVAELTRDKLGYSQNHGKPLNEITRQAAYEQLQDKSTIE